MEYKFRGKRIIGTGWLYGDLVHIREMRFIISDKGGISDYTEVHPASVGMWTGLKDKEGVEIYGNDAVSNPNDSRPYYIIEWNDKQAAFMLGGSLLLRSFCMDEFWLVTGNTTDNPDLLKD
jgi:hypothetical protein